MREGAKPIPSAVLKLLNTPSVEGRDAWDEALAMRDDNLSNPLCGTYSRESGDGLDQCEVDSLIAVGVLRKTRRVGRSGVNLMTVCAVEAFLSATYDAWRKCEERIALANQMETSDE